MTPSTSKDKATTNTKRMQITPQLQKKKRNVDISIEQAIDKLQNISNQCKEIEDDEFDLFCKSLAYQLKKMPLDRALLCQEKLQSVITQERLHQMTYTPSPQHSNSSVHSLVSSSYPNSPASQQYLTASQDIITQAFLDI